MLFHLDMGQFVWGDSRQEFRPLYSLFYVAAYHLWGLRPWGYHICEMFIHALVSVLVFLIAKALAPGDLRRAGFAGILFAVQPPHAQAMSLIVGLVAESLPAALYLSVFLCFIHFRSSGRLRFLVISIGIFAACLLTKESAVTLPLALFSYDLFRISTGNGLRSFREKAGDGSSGGMAYCRMRLTLPFSSFIWAGADGSCPAFSARRVGQSMPLRW